MTRSAKIRLRYAVMGLAVGTFWFLGRNRPAWEEAVRIIISAAVETVLGRWVPAAGVYVAIGLALAIGVGGPQFDRHLFVCEPAEHARQEITR